MDDLIIIGAGISGMTASIFASRYGIKHLIFGENPGGQGNLAHLVENYPGILSIKGPELMKKIIKQVESYGVKIRQERVVELKAAEVARQNFLRAQTAPRQLAGRSASPRFLTRQIGGEKLATPVASKLAGSPPPTSFVVRTEKREYQAKTLILAMGASFRHLNIPGEEKFLGRGVSYCTLCDAPLFRNKVVAVVGGGDSAVSGAIHLASFAKKVYLIHRRDQFRAEKAWVEKLRRKKNIELILSSVVIEVFGREKVEGIRVEKKYAAEVGHENLPGPLLTRERSQGVHDVSGARSEATRANFVASPPQTSREKKLKIDGLFIEIGQVPSSVLAKNLGVELDERGYVLVGPQMATNVPGVFAAGDLAAQRGGVLFRQFITAAADGARAAASVYHFLSKKGPLPSWGKK